LGLKQYDKILMKLNDLFLMNQQVERIFSKMQGDVADANLKAFFKEKELERKRFCEMLQNESKKLEIKVDNSIMLQRRNKLLVKQRDCIQTSSFLIEREADAMGFA